MPVPRDGTRGRTRWGTFPVAGPAPGASPWDRIFCGSGGGFPSCPWGSRDGFVAWALWQGRTPSSPPWQMGTGGTRAGVAPGSGVGQDPTARRGGTTVRSHHSRARALCLFL